MDRERAGLLLLATGALLYFPGIALSDSLVLVAWPVALAGALVLATVGGARRRAAGALAALLVLAALLLLTLGGTMNGVGSIGGVLGKDAELIALVGVPPGAAVFLALGPAGGGPRTLARISVGTLVGVALWLAFEAATGTLSDGLVIPAFASMITGSAALAWESARRVRGARGVIAMPADA
ncbi:MAG TPA: hypothetical protein VM370_10565 [Candidatus Thermoplasmatota archaeon]|nr:hypothetical protein [Candidatus Thermoplasmatota archaeon]